MSEAEIRKYDPEELELQALMGDKFQVGRFQRMDKPAESDPGYEGKFSQPRNKAVPDDSRKATENTTEDANVAEKEARNPVTNNPGFFDKLKECAKTSLAFGGLNLLLFYWEHIGLMAESIAVPSMCVCAALFGLGIGKVIGKGDRR